MKLKSFAALFFRILGVLVALQGLDEGANCLFIHRFAGGLVSFAGGMLLGYCLVKYSKPLAELICKGLEDDDKGDGLTLR